MEDNFDDVQVPVVGEQDLVDDDFDFGEEEVEIVDEVQDNEGDDEPQDESEVETEAKEPKKKQSAEENAKYAAARRDAEAKQKEAENKLNAVLKKFNVKSYEELEEQSSVFTDDEEERLREEAEERGLDADTYVLKKQVAKMQQRDIALKEAKKADAELKAQSREKAKAEIDEFNARFPKVNVDDVVKDAHFMEYADGKLGRKSITEVYEGYLRFTGKTAEQAQYRANERHERSTSVGGGGKSVTLTREQAKQLKAWNEAFPDMAMTASEFVKR